MLFSTHTHLVFWYEKEKKKKILIKKNYNIFSQRTWNQKEFGKKVLEYVDVANHIIGETFNNYRLRSCYLM